ncbi:SOS response-associated peptidase family protein (plasmid) [Novosphingobium resinovorum]|uniref:SOS response-associated peptidase family protein n=1 Tax=Novosphingobium TaxID=165696 RepID=UPI0020030A39|nr:MULTISPECIES: SOS response-associated peptidase family protein [Novosphingobium]WJM30129.1 SOS response-associated peptidase family protein [Novosphingobium resinovorum]
MASRAPCPGASRPTAVSKAAGKPLKPSPVNSARDDKLPIYLIWRGSFRERRCLIPMTQCCEPEGKDRHSTRTWHSLPREKISAITGIWRPLDEWGDAYSMVMVPGCEQMSDIHNRIPTILRRKDWSGWTDETPDEALALLRTWKGPLVVDRTEGLWFQKRPFAATLQAPRRGCRVEAPRTNLPEPARCRRP